MSNNNLKKLIRISDKTYEKLSELGRFHENFDIIINRILQQNSEIRDKR